MPKVTQLVNSRAKICTHVSLAPNAKLFSSSCQTMASLSYISAIISSTVWLVSSKKLSSGRALRFGLGKGRNKSKLLGGDCSTIYKLSPEQASSIRLFLHFWSRELVVAKDRHSGTTSTTPSPFMKIDNNTHLSRLLGGIKQDDGSECTLYTHKGCSLPDGPFRAQHPVGAL